MTIISKTDQATRHAAYYHALAEGTAKKGGKRTILGVCPHCGGNICLDTRPPNRERHAVCLQCARDLCCPPVAAADWRL